MHRLLARQFKKLGLHAHTPPDASQWAILLDKISEAYQQADNDRYTLERSLQISSDEMQEMFQRQKATTEGRLQALVNALQLKHLLQGSTPLAPEELVDLADSIERLLANLGRPRALARASGARARAAVTPVWASRSRSWASPCSSSPRTSRAKPWRPSSSTSSAAPSRWRR